MCNLLALPDTQQEAAAAVTHQSSNYPSLPGWAVTNRGYNLQLGTERLTRYYIRMVF